MKELKYLIVSFTTLILCQIIKFIIESVKEKKLKWGRLFNGSGGMPSSHTSFSFSVVWMILFNEGAASPLFTISLVSALIVGYDAMGHRFESGKQAEAINLLVDKIFDKDYKKNFKKLKEQIGHQPLEVLAGIFLSLITSLIYTYIIL